MTDAERIAGLLRIRASEVDVALTYAEAYDRAWEGTLDIGALMAMLSDVRREEREAIRAIVGEESRASVAASELLASSRLARIAARIGARGQEHE